MTLVHLAITHFSAWVGFSRLHNPSIQVFIKLCRIHLLDGLGISHAKEYVGTNNSCVILCGT